MEFQLPFLQDIVGSKKPFTIVPILTSFSAASLGDPTVRQSVDEFLFGLREILMQAGRAYCVIAAGELAHLGMRYGDKAPPTDFSFHRCMQCDLEMFKPVEERQPEEFADYIRKEQDQRRISGFSPIYSLLRLIQAERGQVFRYDRGITDQYQLHRDLRQHGVLLGKTVNTTPALFSHRSVPRGAHCADLPKLF